MEKTVGQKFYEEQLNYIFANDVESLIENHYHDDAVLIGFDFEVRGHVALKAHFSNYLKQLGHLDVTSTDKFKETADTIFLEAHVVTDLGPAVVYDAFVLNNGKISYHFTGVK